MRLQTQGLAEGFLAGFKTMADYQAQQKADARADKSLALQETSVNEGIKNNEWTRSHTEARDKKADEDSDRNFGLKEKETTANIANQKAQLGISAANLSIARQNADRQNALAEQQRKLTDLQIAREEQQAFVNNNWGLISGGYSNYMQGKPITEQQAKVMMDKRAGSLYFGNYTDPAYVSAATGLQTEINGIAKEYSGGKFKDDELVAKLNSPTILKNMGVVFRDQLNRGVNYIDKATGKKVVKKEIGGMIRVDNGGIAFSVIPVYADGTRGSPQPITENRSNDPNDKVIVYNPEELIGVVNALGNIGRAAKVPETILQTTRVIPEPDQKGYRKEVSDAIVANNKANAKIDLEASKGEITMDKATELKRINDEGLKQTINSYKGVYGMEDATGQGGNGDQQGTDAPTKAVTEWIGNDPQKQRYIQAAVKTGSLNPETVDVKQLDANYQAFLTEQRNKSLEAAALQERVRDAQKNHTR